DNCYYEKIGNNASIKLEDLPFDIPDNWTWIRHNSIYEIFGGSQPPKSKFITEQKDGYIRLYQIRDYGPKPDPIYIPIKDAHKVTKKGDILLARYGASVGKVFFAEDGAYNVAMAKVEKLYEGNYVNRMFLYTFYKSNLYQSLVLNNSRSAQAGFNKEDLDDLYFPLPPLEEQQRIVEKINSFEPLIQEYDKYEKQLTELESTFAEKLKKSILQYAIEGKLVKQDPNDEPASVLLERIKAEKEKLIKEGKIKRDKNESYIYQSDDKNYYENIPDSWSLTTLSKISSLITKGTTPKGGNVSYLNKGIRFLRAENVLGFDKISDIDLKYISEETHNNYLKRSILLEDDILITIAGTLGRTGLVRKKDLPLNTNQAISIVRLINKHLIKLRYLTYVLNAPSIQKCLVDQKKITAIPNLTLEIISNCIIPIAPTNQQNNIVSKLDYLFSLL
ncbi:restriction endonuclease subunit S, partial [Mycoplasmopsis arginini]|uniref:restriction endonuclease subunit S n=1 Tax=Mycoplasmopsis arginini TaxID=2094 RepID=UPI00227AD754